MSEQRRLQVRSDIYRLRQAALQFNCPVIVAVQAKQNLEGTYGNSRIPGIYDGEESSSIGQRCDRIIQLWMPKMTHPLGEELKLNDHQTITVTKELLLVKVGKQRGSLPSGMTWRCQVDFARNEITPIWP